MSGRQPISILKKVNEVRMHYVDKDRIIDYIEALPDKTIILEIPKEASINWDLYKAYASKVDFILCLADLATAQQCKSNGIKFFWGYPINTYYELQSLLKLEPCYLYLGAPLCFDLPRVKEITDIPIRLIPNVAYDGYIPRDNGVCGQWIRPEDVKHYEPYVNALEFITDNLEKERTLLHIYKDNQNWPGNLNLLLTNFGVNIDNRALPDELGPIRIRCGQRCMSNGACHYCHSAMKFATALRHKHYEDIQKDEN
jgi:hypothetical protein